MDEVVEEQLMIIATLLLTRIPFVYICNLDREYDVNNCAAVESSCVSLMSAHPGLARLARAFQFTVEKSMGEVWPFLR